MRCQPLNIRASSLSTVVNQKLAPREGKFSVRVNSTRTGWIAKFKSAMISHGTGTQVIESNTNTNPRRIWLPSIPSINVSKGRGQR
jgi:hypothetical protein